METTRNVPRQTEMAPQGGRERDEADKQIAERLNAQPEPPTPSQEEADEIKEAARTGNQPQEPAAAQPTASQSETAEQRRERERRERDVKPGTNPTSYTTR